MASARAASSVRWIESPYGEARGDTGGGVDTGMICPGVTVNEGGGVIGAELRRLSGTGARRTGWGNGSTWGSGTVRGKSNAGCSGRAESGISASVETTLIGAAEEPVFAGRRLKYASC